MKEEDKRKYCEPTYEELKLLLEKITVHTKKDCEPTYEELKPRYCLPFFLSSPDCEPTYEELKHFSSISDGILTGSLRAYL